MEEEEAEEEGWGVFTVTVRVQRSSYNHICCHYEHSFLDHGQGSKPAFKHDVPLATLGMPHHTSSSSILRRSLD